MKRTIMRLVALSCAAACLVLTALLGACGGVPDYPTLLSQADSAFMQGRYHEGDSLMEAYSRQTAAEADEDDDVRAYRQLLQLEQSFCHGSLAEPDFSLADSLERCYRESEEPVKHAKTLLFVGKLYEITGNYPAALNNYLQAATLAEQQHDTRLLCLVSRCQGDLYFAQRMLEDCIPYYRKCYKLASANRDTLRLSYAAFNMGRVNTINNKIDSIIYFYKQAIDLANLTEQKEHIVPFAINRLCDILIQIEEYDSAAAIMPRNELNDENWGYWHLQQNHLDSAAHYFKKRLGKTNWLVEVELLKILTDIEVKQGNTESSIDYYMKLVDAQDSLLTTSQIAETRKTNAIYNYNHIKQERDDAAKHGQRMEILLISLIVVFFLLITLSILSWRIYKERKDRDIERERRMKRETEKRYKESKEQLEQNNIQLVKLEKELAKARGQHDEEATREIQLKSELLVLENQNIQTSRQRNELMESRLKRSPICLHILSNAGNPNFNLSEEEWQQLAAIIDDTFSDYTARLLDLAKLKPIEIRVCYLLKIGLQQADIAPIILRTKSAISMMCKRICQKLHLTENSAKDLYLFLQRF